MQYFLINNFYLVEADNFSEAAKKLVSIKYVCFTNVNFTMVKDNLEEITSCFKTSNSLSYWKRQLSNTGIAEVARYHLF